jgi:hypothetical protein
MKSCNTYLVVAAMAVAGIGMSAHAADNTANTPGNDSTPMQGNTAQMQSTSSQMQTTGGKVADESTAKEARKTLARIINDGVEQDKFSSFTSYLTKADRERLGDVKKVNEDDLNNVIKQFRQDFKDKYNQDFDISADHLSDAVVYEGQDKKSATVTLSKPIMSSTPMDNMSTTNNMSSTKATNSNTTGTSGATADRTLNTTGNEQTVSNRSGDNSGSGLTSTSAGNRTGEATNGSNSNSTVHGNDVTATPGVVAGATDMAKSNNTAALNNMNTMADANAAAGMSSLTLNFINEGHVMNAWRISDPQISAEQLKQNLVKHIQTLDDQKAAWPADVNAAYSKVAYHVLSAFNDTALATER